MLTRTVLDDKSPHSVATCVVAMLFFLQNIKDMQIPTHGELWQECLHYLWYPLPTNGGKKEKEGLIPPF